MVKPRLLFFLILAASAAAVSAFVLFSSGLARWTSLSVALLIIGFVFGLLWRKQRRHLDSHMGESKVARPPDFSPELLATSINEMREGLLVIDADMRVLASNRVAQHLLSNVEPSITSRRLTELTRNPAIYDAFLDGVRGTERSGVKVETFGPERRVFDLRVVPLRSVDAGEISGALGIFFDVTRLERLELIRQEFLSNVSHELRTPLTSIIALTETLEDGALADNQNNRRFLSIIRKNSTRMHRLIDDILELSAIEAGNVKVSSEWVPLRLLVDDIVGSLSPGASRSVRVDNQVPSNAKVFADPHRLAQMLTNLIENAVKFNRDGGRVTIRYETDNT